MANTRDFTGKNRQFTGTKGIVLPKGTTGERVDTEGEIRFNTTLQLAEYYDGTAWKSIDAPPTISGVTNGTNLAADGSTTHTVTINGSNFSIGATVQFIGNTGTTYNATNVNRVNGAQVTCSTTSTMGTGDDPYSVKLTNTSGLSFTLADVVTFNAVPNAGSNFLGLIWTGRVVSGSSLNASTTDPEGDTITYSVVPGYALPSGLSINSSTGYITGTVGITVTEGFNYVFKIRASTSSGSRDYQCFVTGASATISADILMVGGGGGGTNYSGGAGAGEVIFISSRAISRGTTFPLVIGAGGPGRVPGDSPGINGIGTVTTGFSETVKTGGGGHGADGSQTPSAQIGNGEGGGSRSGAASGTQGTSVGTGVTRYGGYSGGTGSCSANYPGGGGGGAGGNGSPATPNTAPAGAGGAGVDLNITGTPYFWAGGGGGASHTNGSGGNGGNGGGGGGGCQGGSAGTGGSGLNPGQNGVGPGSPHKGGNGGANTGGGGGSGPGNATVVAGNGGTGIVVVRYVGASTIATGGTVTSYSQGGTTYQVHTFTSSSNFITD